MSATFSMETQGADRVSRWEAALDHIEAWALSREAPDHPGLYRRRDDLPLDSYGTCDLICILYTLDRLHDHRDKFARWAQGIGLTQDPETGKFRSYEGADHREYHQAAFTLGALQLIGEKAPYPCRFVEELREWPACEAWLEERDWDVPWTGAGHDVAALISIFELEGNTNAGWFERMFDWLDREQDSATGYWRKGRISEDLINHLGAAFHLYFAYEHFRRPIRHADAIYQTTRDLMRPNGFWQRDNLWPRGTPYLELDGAYTLARTSRVVQERRQDCYESLTRTIEAVDAFISNDRVDEFCIDTHHALAVVTLISILQEVCPSRVPLRRRLKNVLDRRPFI